VCFFVENLQKEALGLNKDSGPDTEGSAKDEDGDDEPKGPKPMLPYSSMFILSPTNPCVYFTV